MKNSKILLPVIGISATSVVLFVLFGDLGAQTPRDAAVAITRVAVCDVAEVFDNYKRAKDILGKLEVRSRRIKSENEKRGKAIEALQLELESLKKGSKKYEQTMNEIQRLTIERQAWLQFQDSLAARDQHRFTKEMYDEILKMVGTLAKAKGIDLVLYREGKAPPTQTMAELLRTIRSRRVLYSANAIDITEETLRRLNDSYTKAAKR